VYLVCKLYKTFTSVCPPTPRYIPGMHPGHAMLWLAPVLLKRPAQPGRSLTVGRASESPTLGFTRVGTSLGTSLEPFMRWAHIISDRATVSWRYSRSWRPGRRLVPLHLWLVRGPTTSIFGCRLAGRLFLYIFFRCTLAAVLFANATDGLT
jgi:hypothetical protein